MDVKYLLMDFFKSKSFGDFLTKRMIGDFYKFNNSSFEIMGTKNAIYYIDDLLFIIKQVIDEYNFYDIHNTDIVLDIGACNGGFSLEIHNMVDKVFAIEPIFINELKKHIKLNNAQNILPLQFALGPSNSKQCINFLGREMVVECKSLSELIYLCGGHIDVLKIDCEGGEWYIKPHELDGIRRIEGEIHSFNNERLDDFTDMLSGLGYDIKIIARGMSTILLSAYMDVKRSKYLRNK